MRIWTRSALAGLRDHVVDRQAEQLEVAGDRLRAVHGRARSPAASASGREVVDHVQHELPDAPSIVAWWYFVSSAQVVALQALDDVHLPQRAAAVHRPPDDAGDLLGELVGVARRGQAQWRMWKSRSKFGSSIQYGWSRCERHLDEPPAHRLELADLRLEALVDRGVRVEVGVRPIVDRSPYTWPNVVGDSMYRKLASIPVSCFIGSLSLSVSRLWL